MHATGWSRDAQSRGTTPPWVNLFRRSEPLGFRVFSDGEGTHDRYVPEVPVDIGGDPGPRVMTHSGYPHTGGLSRGTRGLGEDRYRRHLLATVPDRAVLPRTLTGQVQP